MEESANDRTVNLNGENVSLDFLVGVVPDVMELSEAIGGVKVESFDGSSNPMTERLEEMENCDNLSDPVSFSKEAGCSNGDQINVYGANYNQGSGDFGFSETACCSWLGSNVKKNAIDGINRQDNVIPSGKHNDTVEEDKVPFDGRLLESIPQATKEAGRSTVEQQQQRSDFPPSKVARIDSGGQQMTSVSVVSSNSTQGLRFTCPDCWIVYSSLEELQVHRHWTHGTPIPATSSTRDNETPDKDSSPILNDNEVCLDVITMAFETGEKVNRYIPISPPNESESKTESQHENRSPLQANNFSYIQCSSKTDGGPSQHAQYTEDLIPDKLEGILDEQISSLNHSVPDQRINRADLMNVMNSGRSENRNRCSFVGKRSLGDEFKDLSCTATSMDYLPSNSDQSSVKNAIDDAAALLDKHITTLQENQPNKEFLSSNLLEFVESEDGVGKLETEDSIAFLDENIRSLEENEAWKHSCLSDLIDFLVSESIESEMFQNMLSEEWIEPVENSQPNNQTLNEAGTSFRTATSGTTCKKVINENGYVSAREQPSILPIIQPKKQICSDNGMEFAPSLNKNVGGNSGADYHQENRANHQESQSNKEESDGRKNSTDSRPFGQRNSIGKILSENGKSFLTVRSEAYRQLKNMKSACTQRESDLNSVGNELNGRETAAENGAEFGSGTTALNVNQWVDVGSRGVVTENEHSTQDQRVSTHEGNPRNEQTYSPIPNHLTSSRVDGKNDSTGSNGANPTKRKLPNQKIKKAFPPNSIEENLRKIIAEKVAKFMSKPKAVQEIELRRRKVPQESMDFLKEESEETIMRIIAEKVNTILGRNILPIGNERTKKAVNAETRKPIQKNFTREKVTQNNKLETRFFEAGVREVVTKEKTYGCDLCGHFFALKDELKKHLQLHITIRIGKPVDKPSKKATIEESQKVPSSFQCEQCDKKFKRNQDLKRHLVAHSGIKPFKCLHCDMSFAEACKLKSHSRVHSEDRPFACDVCQMRFGDLGDLRRHAKTHGEKDFSCELCEKKYTELRGLNRHMRTHLGSFRCTICGKRFADNGTLNSHLATHTEEFRCQLCDKSFRVFHLLTKHLRTHSPKSFQTLNTIQ